MHFLRDGLGGRRVYIIKVIEYQRRGLPHAHIVYATATPPQSGAHVDEYISCELPDESDPELRNLV